MRWVWVLNLVRNVSIVMDPYSIDYMWAIRGCYMRWVWGLNLVRNISIVMNSYSIDR